MGGCTVVLLSYMAAALLGAVVAMMELASRYRDAPLRSIATGAGAVYVLVNAVAAGIGLAVVRSAGLDFGLNSQSSSGKLVEQTLFGALVLQP
jgi:hypothetical protein